MTVQFLAMLAAFVGFTTGFVLELAGVGTKRINLMMLGLALLALAFLAPLWSVNVHG